MPSARRHDKCAGNRSDMSVENLGKMASNIDGVMPPLPSTPKLVVNECR
jgi:hypothetical protein